MISLIYLAKLLTYFEHLIAASARGMLVLIIAAALCFALRRASASARHLAWSAALVSLLVLPVLSLGLPSWQIAVLPRSSIEALAQSPANAPVVVARVEAPSASQTIRPDEIIYDEKPVSAKKESLASEKPVALVAAEKQIEEKGEPVAGIMAGTLKGASLGWTHITLLIWIAGALFCMARLFVGTVSVWRMRRQASEITGSDLINLAGHVASRLGLKRRVMLLKTRRITMPVTCGLFRSAVLLPADCDEWSGERREVVLLHEMTHVKRWDCLTQMLAQVACAVYWFNPLVWIAARNHRIERELACDDLVLGAGTKASDYAGHLLDIARSFQPASSSLLAAVALARRSQLEGRLLAILDSNRGKRGVSRLASICVALVIACVVLPLSVVRLSAQADSKQSPRVKPSATASAINQASTLNVDSMPESAIEAIAQAERRAEQAIEAELSEAVVGQLEDAGEQQAEQSGQIEGKDRSAAIEALRGALKDEDSEVRENALFALSQSGDPQAVEALIDALKDANPQVRERAAWGLGLRGNQSAVEPLIGALQDSAWQVREQAAWALGLKGDSRAVEPLINALKDQSDQVREQAAWALGLKGDRRAVEPLMDALKDSISDVREQAAWALGLKGDRRAISALKELLKEQKADVREQAAWALGMILMRHGGSPDNDERDKEDDEDDEINLAQSNRIEIDQKGRTGRGVSGGITGGVKGGVKGGINGGIAGGVSDGVKGGTKEGIKGGVSGGIREGISSGVRSGVRGGVKGGVSGGVRGGIATTNDARIVKPDAEKKKPK